MKKNLLVLIFLSFGFLVNAQDIAKTTAIDLVTKNMTAAHLTQPDLSNVIVSSAYHDRSTGLDMVYLQQSYKGLPVYNQIQVLAFRNGLLVSNAGGRIAGIEKMISHNSTDPSVSAEAAVRTVMAEKHISTSQSLIPVLTGTKLDFGKLGVAYENVTAELMWVILKGEKEVRLAWQVYLVPTTTSDYWMIRIDANNNKVIAENNLTVSCTWNSSKKNQAPQYLSNNFPETKQQTTGLFDFTRNTNAGQNVSVSPSIVNGASYKVIKYPAESPRHPGGTPALVTDPWTPAAGNATSLKWHSTGSVDYTITRGNNVWAKEDHASNNSNSGAPATSTTSPDPLSFDFQPNFTKSPSQTSPVPNQQFNITNLFYWINTYHDILYQYGFDEPAGNFQANNQGRGGAAGDFVYGDAQDGNFVAPNQNNANFSTPADGGNGRMQMYLWDTAATLFVNTPASISKYYSATESGFSTANKLINLGPVTGQVVFYNDQAATTHEACVAASNSLAGKIALIIRGNCNFTVKVKNAQNAGAIGVIMVNNVVGNNVIMAGSDNTITIPAVFISQADGAIFTPQLANNLNVTLYAANIDGDVDNGVVMHEHTHGLSNRLTGGPAQAGCLGNAENMGEGWSDYYSLMLTQDWANSTLSDGEDFPRAIGTYAIGQAPQGTGIRTQLYCTNFAVNNLVYGPSVDPESHNRGELWCATLWDMTWNIILQTTTINPNIYDVSGGGGNNIAMKLVTEGMKLQPCSPGFIDGRNAILQADQVLYGGAYACAIKEAFRRRGMGPSAIQGSSDNVGDQVADFTVVPCANCTGVATTTQPANTTACTGSTASFTVTVTGTTPTYQWQVSTNGGGTFTNITGATAATLDLTNVTPGMNSYQYQVVISNTCPSTVTSTPAILTVNSPASITSQPTNFTACEGAAANFSVTAAGSTNTYQWQVSTNGGGSFSDITGATTTTLNLPGITAVMDGNQYQLVITSCGPTPLISNVVTLTVNSPATISAQPANTNACTGGGDATFTVAAGGNSLTYQWQVSTNGGGTFSNIPGATATTLLVTGITSTMNGYIYQVIITNPCTASLISSQASLTVSDPASITTQPPAAATLCAGDNTSFTITTAGTGVTYQWQVSTDGGGTFTDITGATSATLNLNGVTATMNNNVYHVLVFSCSPTGLSSTSTLLTVNSPVSVTAAPANTNACVGNDATFTVTAGGTSNTYQWQVSTDGGGTFTDITGATSATLTVTGVTAGMDNYIYHVFIANTCTPAGITSANGTLTVSNAASITTQPVNATSCEGTDAVFTATASGASYQWQQSTDNGATFTDITGATTTTLTLTGVTAAMNGYQYQLVIASCGSTSISTNHVTLTVNSPASITNQPASTSACTGADAVFTVTGAGSATTYQWNVSTDGGATYLPITGATSATLTLTAVTTTMDGNLYQVTLSNSCTASLNSNPVTLTVNPASSISTPPADVTVCEAASADFNVTAANATGGSYQWQVSTDGGATFTDITGATGTTLNLPSVTPSMNNNIYHVAVTACGTVTSTGATLTVNALPVVTITASPYTDLTPGQTTILTATSTPAATDFTWYNNGVPVTASTTSTLPVASTDTGSYTVSVTGANGCSNTSAALHIGAKSIAFIYPNPASDIFYVTFPGVELNNKSRILSMFDSKGARVYQKAYPSLVPYGIMEVHTERFSSGVYEVVLYDAAGIVLATGKVVIRR